MYNNSWGSISDLLVRKWHNLDMTLSVRLHSRSIWQKWWTHTSCQKLLKYGIVWSDLLQWTSFCCSKQINVILSFTGPPVLSLGSPFPGLMHSCFLFFESERAEECFWTTDWSECILTALGVTRHSFRSRLLVKSRTFQMVCCVLLFIIASCFSLYVFKVYFPFIVKCFVIFVKGTVFY